VFTSGQTGFPDTDTYRQGPTGYNDVPEIEIALEVDFNVLFAKYPLEEGHSVPTSGSTAVDSQDVVFFAAFATIKTLWADTYTNSLGETFAFLLTEELQQIESDGSSTVNEDKVRRALNRSEILSTEHSLRANLFSVKQVEALAASFKAYANTLGTVADSKDQIEAPYRQAQVLYTVNDELQILDGGIRFEVQTELLVAGDLETAVLLTLSLTHKTSRN
jgi:hypothetical protein